MYTGTHLLIATLPIVQILQFASFIITNDNLINKSITLLF